MYSTFPEYVYSLFLFKLGEKSGIVKCNVYENNKFILNTSVLGANF